MSPKHYAIGQNVQSGTVYFDNTKTVVVSFTNPFQQPPIINLTMNDSGAIPAYKTNVTTTQFKIKFKNAWMGEVDWQAMER